MSKQQISDAQSKALLEILHRFFLREKLYPPDLDPKNSRQVCKFIGGFLKTMSEKILERSGS
jgi:hypothetical protein